MTAQYRIQGIQKVRLNGKEVKAFEVLELKGDAYVFIGTRTAPAKTANKNLVNFI
jgi:hypothetical protein